MKWTSHRLITTSIIFALTGKPVPCVFAYMGSTLPDSLEFILPESMRKSHRSHSHWWVYYAAFAAISYFVLHFYRVDVCSPMNLAYVNHMRHYGNYAALCAALIHPIIFWLCIGALFHIVEDMVTAPVPLWTPHKKAAPLGVWFSAGSKKEFIFAFTVFIVLAFVGLYRCGYLTERLPQDIARLKANARTLQN